MAVLLGTLLPYNLIYSCEEKDPIVVWILPQIEKSSEIPNFTVKIQRLKFLPIFILTLTWNAQWMQCNAYLKLSTIRFEWLQRNFPHLSLKINLNSVPRTTDLVFELFRIWTPLSHRLSMAIFGFCTPRLLIQSPISLSTCCRRTLQTASFVHNFTSLSPRSSS